MATAEALSTGWRERRAQRPCAASSSGLVERASQILSEGASASAEGWDAESATADTRMDDAFVMLDVEGPGLAELLSKAMTLDFATSGATLRGRAGAEARATGVEPKPSW